MQAFRNAIARFFARAGYEVVVTDEGRVIIAGTDKTDAIDADYARGQAEGAAHYVAPTIH